MELAARLAVLLACGVAGGALFVVVAAPVRARPPAPVPIPLAGRSPIVLAAFIVLAAGTVLTGAGSVDARFASAASQAAGIALLAVTGILATRSAISARRATAAAEPAIVPSASLLVLAWAGAALATISWILALGAVAVAVLAGIGVERRG